MTRALPVLWLFAASVLLAQDPYADRWSELRRRIAEGGDVSQLLNQWDRKGTDARTGQIIFDRVHPAAGFRVLPSLAPARDLVRVAACAAGVHPALALAIVEHETGFNNRARGEKGEIGAGQIMPATALTFGFDLNRLARDYDYNVRSAVEILRYLVDYFDGDEEAAIRGYNGGPAWRSARPATLGQIERYAASVSGLRSKYVPVTCG
jgi:soluble lytic murein transglycosylase-like protein